MAIIKPLYQPDATVAHPSGGGALRSGWFPVTTLGLSLTGRRLNAPHGRQQSRADRLYLPTNSDVVYHTEHMADMIGASR
jgi:hypothetical protein